MILAALMANSNLNATLGCMSVSTLSVLRILISTVGSPGRGLRPSQGRVTGEADIPSVILKI